MNNNDSVVFLDSEMATFKKVLPATFIVHLVKRTNPYAALSNVNFEHYEMLTFIAIFIRSPAFEVEGRSAGSARENCSRAFQHASLQPRMPFATR